MTSADAFSFDSPGNDIASLKKSIANKLVFSVGKDPAAARPEDWLHAVAYAVRDRLVERWMQTHMARLRLTEAERAVWNQGLAERAKKGMSMLAEYKRDGVASYADFEDCPLCVGASDAARKP